MNHLAASLVAALVVVLASLSGCGESEPAPAQPTVQEPIPIVENPVVHDEPVVKKAAHTMDLTGLEIPNGEVWGLMGGEPFTLDRVEHHVHTKAFLLHGTGGQVVFVFMQLKDGLPESGHSWDIATPSDAFDQPHIHVHYDTPGDRQMDTYMNKYVMRLKIGAKEGDSYPAKIYLCLPDGESYLKGSFKLPANFP